MATHINPQDLRVQRTRKHLQQAFLQLLSEKEFGEITIQDIADHAEVNRATFYKHFQDKFELMDVTIAKLFIDTFCEYVPDNACMNEETLTKLMHAVCDWHTGKQQCGHYPLTHHLMIEQITKQHLYQRLLMCFQHTPELADQDTKQLEMVSTMISWSIYGITLQWSKNKTQTIESLIAEALPLLMSPIKTLSIA